MTDMTPTVPPAAARARPAPTTTTRCSRATSTTSSPPTSARSSRRASRTRRSGAPSSTRCGSRATRCAPSTSRARPPASGPSVDAAVARRLPIRRRPPTTLEAADAGRGTVVPLDDHRRGAGRVGGSPRGPPAGSRAAVVFGAMFVIPGRHQVRPNVAAVVTQPRRHERQAGRPDQWPGAARAHAELPVTRARRGVRWPSPRRGGRCSRWRLAVVLGATADAASGDAARFVEQMRAAAGAHDFTATVEVTWHNAAGARKQATVDRARGRTARSRCRPATRSCSTSSGHTFVKDELGWWTPPSEPRPSRHPSPDARWHLAAASRDGTRSADDAPSSRRVPTARSRSA